MITLLVLVIVLELVIVLVLGLGLRVMVITSIVPLKKTSKPKLKMNVDNHMACHL